MKKHQIFVVLTVLLFACKTASVQQLAYPQEKAFKSRLITEEAFLQAANAAMANRRDYAYQNELITLEEQLYLNTRYKLGGYALFDLDVDMLEADTEIQWVVRVPDSVFLATRVKLPMPYGTLKSFYAWKSPVMSDSLRLNYPDIQTYAGYAVDDPSITTRFEITSDGLSGSIISNNETFCIKKLRDFEKYISHTRESVIRSRPLVEYFQPDTTTLDTTQIESIDFMAQRSGKVKRRVLRLAVAGTTEYTAYFGSPRKAFENVIKAVQRVNLIYERDFALSFLLVDGSDKLMFETNDTYDNDSTLAMSIENQRVLDSLIGNQNYDIGHVFATGKGGRGELPSACIDSVKAMGATGDSVPEGERFYVDYFAHELGHQLGANHTFAGFGGACENGRWQRTAYEPGSGTTIMGYANLCEDDDVQNHSDDYFHYISLKEINEYLDEVFAGGCGSSREGNNSYPSINLPGNSYTIPYLTPFKLQAIPYDTDLFDNLNVTWEQVNLTRPLVRSKKASRTHVRNIPNIKDHLSGKNLKWEKLPDRKSELNFVATVRDNRIEQGGINSTLLKIDVSPIIDPFEVFRPTSGSLAQKGKHLNIRWVKGTNKQPVNCKHVDIFISLDGGSTFELVAFKEENDGKARIKLPNSTSKNCVILVQASDNVFYNISRIFEISE